MSRELRARTYETLDYHHVRRALADRCSTAPARRMAEDVMDEGGEGVAAADAEGSRRRYGCVEELGQAITQGSPPPLTGKSNLDLAPTLEHVISSGRVMEIEELKLFADACIMLTDIRHWTDESLWNENDAEALKEKKKGPHPFPLLEDLVEPLYIPEELTELLTTAFDKDDPGQLCGKRFPTLKTLRDKISSLRRSVLQQLQSLLKTPSFSSMLSLPPGGAAAGYSEVDGRFVVPLSPTFKNRVGGIVHDVSRTGRTLYVEPPELVGPTNDARRAEAELRAEERRLLRVLTQAIVKGREHLSRSVAAAAQLDLVLARVRLGDVLAGSVPEVGEEGVLRAPGARHPVLSLRTDAVQVVPNHLDVGTNGRAGLVLTGPNSGGKTVVLKLLGLLALMARDGVPVPAEPGARVDFFDVLADIGDMQSVDGDLSTFSGHMLVCREVLRRSGRRSLVLMDEMGSGTDPKQGVAIAQALLEELLEAGARVAVTTHFLELKQLAASDHRFAVAGMQFVDGRPTYRLQPGAVGESFALAVAKRLELPPRVLERSRELLDDETRQIGDLLQDLEGQKEAAERQTRLLAAQEEELVQMRAGLEEARRELEAKRAAVRREEAKKFSLKMEEREDALRDILEKLKEDPRQRLVARSWDDLRLIKEEVLESVREKDPSQPRDMVLTPLTKPDLAKVKVGDTLVICRDGSMRGQEGKVLSKGSKDVELSLGAMSMRLKLREVAFPTQVYADYAAARQTTGARSLRDIKKKKKSAVSRRVAEEADAVETRQPGRAAPAPQTGGEMRTESNTVDLRGKSVQEAASACLDAFSMAKMNGRRVVYLLTGHGPTGALKEGVRRWLGNERQKVKRYSGADQEDGGDAFTKVELR